MQNVKKIVVLPRMKTKTPRAFQKAPGVYC
jgi:hypothetical protein